MISSLISAVVVTAAFVVIFNLVYQGHDLPGVVIVGFAAIIGFLNEILSTLKESRE